MKLTAEMVENMKPMELLAKQVSLLARKYPEGCDLTDPNIISWLNEIGIGNWRLAVNFLPENIRNEYDLLATEAEKLYHEVVDNAYQECRRRIRKLEKQRDKIERIARIKHDQECILSFSNCVKKLSFENRKD